MELQPIQDAFGFSRCERFIKAGWRMRIELILDDHDLVCMWKMNIYQFPHTFCPICFCASRSYFHVAPILERSEGHVRAVKRMVEEDTACPEVLVQIAAIRAALNSVGQVILEDHLRSCMVKAVHDGEFEDAMRDLKKSLDQFIS